MNLSQTPEQQRLDTLPEVVGEAGVDSRARLRQRNVRRCFRPERIDREERMPEEVESRDHGLRSLQMRSWRTGLLVACWSHMLCLIIH